jgi:hypothetical protein
MGPGSAPSVSRNHGHPIAGVVGIPTSTRSATHDTATYQVMIHFAWTFLDPSACAAATQACLAWFLFHHLCHRAALTSVASLHNPRSPPSSPTKLPLSQSLQYACALLHFNFYYGDFGRWLGGKYTNCHSGWEQTFSTLKQSVLRRRHQTCRQSTSPADFASAQKESHSKASTRVLLKPYLLGMPTTTIPWWQQIWKLWKPNLLRKKKSPFMSISLASSPISSLALSSTLFNGQ